MRRAERVGGVEGRRRLVEAEEQLDHLRNLVLLGAAIADDRALDFGRRVFHHLAACFHRREHRDSAGVAQQERAPHVGGVEQVFDRDAVGAPG